MKDSRFLHDGDEGALDETFMTRALTLPVNGYLRSDWWTVFGRAWSQLRLPNSSRATTTCHLPYSVATSPELETKDASTIHENSWSR